MRNTLSALARWSAIGGLWALIVVLIVPTMVMHWTSGAGLWVIEALASRANELRTGGRA